MADAKHEAYNALFTEIARQASSEEISKFHEPDQARIIRDLALAFRYASGGAQPGAVVVESK